MKNFKHSVDGPGLEALVESLTNEIVQAILYDRWKSPEERAEPVFFFCFVIALERAADSVIKNLAEILKDEFADEILSLAMKRIEFSIVCAQRVALCVALSLSGAVNKNNNTEATLDRIVAQTKAIKDILAGAES